MVKFRLFLCYDVQPTPTEYFAVMSGLEMDLAPVIAMNFMY